MKEAERLPKVYTAVIYGKNLTLNFINVASY